MQTYISFLRGINVGGHRKILMADLKDLYVALGFEQIVSYIQSGNVVFETPETDTKKLEHMISDAIQKQYGYDVACVIRTCADIQKVLQNNPFSDEEYVHVAFLQGLPESAHVDALCSVDVSPDRFKVVGDHVYLCYQHKCHASKLQNHLLEKKLGVLATVRNWKTCNKMLDLSKK